MHILDYIKRKRWRQNLMKYAEKFKAIVIRIQ